MILRLPARIGANIKAIAATHAHVSVGILAVLMVLVYTPCKADVPPPLAAPAVPGDYCGTLYNELYTNLQAFNNELQTPPSWTPVSGGPTVYSATLAWANSNTGPQISNASYLPTVLAELQQVKALGVQAVSIPILFPILYEPFYGSQATFQPYLTFYESVAQAARALGLKVIVDSEIMFSSDIQAGWSNMNNFYSTLTWPEYMAARAQMAATIAQNIQPDFLILANEPDTESVQAGQTNLNIPADAAQMIAGEIAAVQALNMTNPPKLGAGFGTWMPTSGDGSLANYASAYLAIPSLDYIDYHLLPVNTVNNDNFLDNALTLASMAAAAGKPVGLGQAWLSKVAASEQAGGYNTSNLDVERSRQTFSFWQPLDSYYMQVMQTLANYEQMLYLDLEQTFYVAAYQPYGGTAANGGSANCTCTTTTCSDYEIMQTEDPLAVAAGAVSTYTGIGFSYYNQLVTTPDTTPPSLPTGLTGTAGTTQVGLTWTASTDDVGVAGYNVYRCSPPAQGQPCTGVWIANSTLPSYIDSTLTSNTPYNYQVQAFDLANNHSPVSSTMSVMTYRTSADSATNLVATTVSAQEIDLSWSPPSNTTGLGEYLIYAGTSPSSLQQVATRGSTYTTYRNLNLAANTTYYFGVVAVEQGINAPMSTEAYATTLPLPPPPSNVAGIPTASSMALTWQENLLPKGLPISFYQIYEGTTPGKLTQVGSASSAKYTATSLSPNTTYYFEIAAVDTGHDISTPSDQITLTTAATPAAPANVAATGISATSIKITWSETVPPNGLAITSYNIFRGTSPTGLTQLTTRTASPFTDTGVSASTTYYYAVRAVDSGKDLSPMSATATVTTPPMPAAPVNVGGTANSATNIALSWSENVPPNGLPVQFYNVFRGTSPSSLSKLTSRTSSPFTDTGATANTSYYYAIQAVDSGSDVSPMSATIEVTTPAMPAAPANVGATANSSTKVTVSWSETVPPNGRTIQYYNVYRGTSSSGLSKLTARTATPCIDAAASPNTTYYYAIQAVDTSGDLSPMSSTVQVNTPTQ